MTLGPGRFMETLRSDERLPPPDLSKGASRLEDKKAAKKLDLVNEKKFKAEVWARDQKRCRHCKRKVIKTIERIPERGEVHHVHGRDGVLAFDSRFALLLCLEHHEQVTGRVAEKWIIEPAKKGGGTLTLPGSPTLLTDARKKVIFRRVA